mgnify:FL=1
MSVNTNQIKGINRLDSLYQHEKYDPVINKARAHIFDALKGTNLESVDFNYVCGTSVYLAGKAKNGLGYLVSLPVDTDFSNIDEIVHQFIISWLDTDTKENNEFVNSFVREGNEWGWD